MALTKEDLQAIAALLQPIHGQLDGLETNVSEVKTDVAELGAGVSEVKTDVAELGAGVMEMKADVAKLEAVVTEMKRKLFEVEIRVSAAYDFALEAWGKSVENRKWLERAR